MGVEALRYPRKENMDVQCTCGDWHDLTPVGMILVIQSFQNGELVVIGGKPVQITSRCLRDAFTPENVEEIRRKYPQRKLEV